MSTHKLAYLSVLLSLLLTSGCASQHAPKSVTGRPPIESEDGPTPKPELAQTVRLMHTYRPTNKLVGNACVSDYTREMGFEYVYPFTTPGIAPNRLHSFFHNLWLGTRLTFKQGPLWGKRVKARIKQCRASSGDFVG